MFWTRKVVIGDGERGLVYRNRQFEAVLGPGTHRWFDPRGERTIVLHDIRTPRYDGADADLLMARHDASLQQAFLLADIGPRQIGLVYYQERLCDVLAPAARQLYWRGLVPVRVETLPLEAVPQVPAEVVLRLRQIGLLSRYTVTTHVPEQHAALVFIDGQLACTLGPGPASFWNLQNNVVVDVVDLRLHSVEVGGQELLTRDKVSLRVNLSASTRVVDPVAARTGVAKVGEQVYRELQFALRQAVSARSLDELLGDKAALDAEILASVRARVAGLGTEVLGVGVKDVILPGEMREIFNAVVQAEKQAQANVVRRREEANATRSLLNTAKLIEDNPVLMRLKELEALEKVTEKIDKLTVFGGLDGVLKQLVTMKP
ncbi:slipin family protein [Stenotrophomonas sp. BIGb0135]|uniref:slipin family protein n=1 Tax=Stenotrophomonas sp. BIGb0135 TaxID=2940620 RepID=UPI002168CE22|nr:slipin family protein [Stenotrophomonas sp. BIGb0135]MCS4236558.1 regulator of protease activity HflC (stomatin/prohibitin superfamily) [Stenotrophomonas sp. BIGb0135]